MFSKDFLRQLAGKNSPTIVVSIAGPKFPMIL